MALVIIGMSILFAVIGFIVTEKNAKNLLAGYNSLDEEERQKVDLQSYIPFFRKFHIFLAVSFLMFGLTLTFAVNQNAGGVFLAVYPILAYMYFIWSGRRFSKHTDTKYDIIALAILALVLVFITGLFAVGFTESKLTFDSKKIKLHGIYGETINRSDIDKVELVDQLPEIAFKKHGFAMGSINKGFFKTKKGEEIKLMLNSRSDTYILISKSDGKKIYFSKKDGENRELFTRWEKLSKDK